MASHVATTGVPELDDALGGLFWGDNVVLDADDEEAVDPFVRAVLAAPGFDHRAFVVLGDRTPSFLGDADVVDARSGADLDAPRPLLDAIARRCSAAGRHLIVFDTLDHARERWGTETTARFFARVCPLLFGLGAIGYFSLTTARRSPALRREIEEIAQCVLVVGSDTLRVAKAEGRPPSVEGLVFRHVLDDEGRPAVTAASTAARLGEALLALRADRRLSQSELGRLAGVSASAISQAERGRRGLSLETLLNLSAKLDLSLDELLRGDVAPRYRLARRDDPRHAERDRPVPLLDDPRAGIRVYVVRLSPGASARPEFAHKGVEVVTVATGLIQVRLASGRPVLRQGEALLADRSGVEGWRNLTDRDAVAFWLLHDAVGLLP